MAKSVYSFGGGAADGSAEMRDLLGGKGANLAEMSALGLPVPPGFTITTEVCTWFYQNGRGYPDGLEAGVAAALARVEEIAGTRFGDAKSPLLVSVRSGARVSMPGMMDTVLNLGLNDETVEGLARRAGDKRFAYDSYRRFIQMYGDVVLGVEHHNFEEILELHKEDRGVTLDTELTAEDWETVVEAYKARVEEALGRPFPQDPTEQLWGAIGAVFGSWRVQRAVTYRKLHGIPEDWGTAVNVQAMVFGNMGEDCATGVAFTRNPSTGENAFYGEYLVNAQGEDVVAGIRTPQHLTVAGKIANGSTLPAMEEVMPEVFSELETVRDQLEAHYRDMQDIEFTVQKGKLFMLQTRSGKRTATWCAKNSSASGKRWRGSSPLPSTSFCTRRSIPRPGARSSRADCRPPPAPLPAASPSPPTRPRTAPPRARRSSWCAPRPAPRTSTACMPRRESSPPAVA